MESSSQTSLESDEMHLNGYILARTPGLHPNLTHILEQLRVVSHLMDRGSLDESERAYFSSTVFLTQYQLTQFHGNGIFDASEWQNPYIASIYSSPNHDTSSCIGLCMYINIVLRKLPPKATLHYVMAKQLKCDLEKSGDDLVLTWGSDPELLLWILFMGAAATAGRLEHSYFVEKLAFVERKLQLSELEDFRKVLKATVWSDTFHSPQSTALWEETHFLLSS